MEKETNAGYEILKTVYVGNRKFVLGYNPKAPQPYVTWKYPNRRGRNKAHIKLNTEYHTEKCK